jgi:predicted transposase YbfD/YdcC
LLEQINLPDALVTIDAMGCQKDVVEQIVAGKGDFAIAVKVRWTPFFGQK